jgi:probable HAF family extracellular repeat protein
MDLGSKGGPNSTATVVNSGGGVVGYSLDVNEQPLYALLWKHGKIMSLGGDGYPVSQAWGLNDPGEVTGFLDTGNPDPNGEDFCSQGDNNVCLPFVWQKGKFTVLPLPGGDNGTASLNNNRGEIAGSGETGVVDPNCVPPQVYDEVATVWGPRKGELRTLPPYGSDTEAVAFAINQKGEVVGTSGKCKFFYQSFGYIEAVLWRNGWPINLGSLGGKLFNIGFSINNKSEVTGQASLSGGGSGVPQFHAYLWRKGVMKDLGVLPGDFFSIGNSINDRTQIVGQSFPPSGYVSRAFLWQNGAMYDINTLLPKHSNIDVFEPDSINNRGQIVGTAFDRKTGNTRAFLATPCDAQNPDHKGCQDARGASTPIVLPENARRTLMRRNALHHIYWPPKV